jgi:predicted ester cyclase
MPASEGRGIEVTAIGIWRVADGKIAEVWMVFDALGMMQQPGITSTS